MKIIILLPLFYLLLFQSAYAQMPTGGLVAYWTFDEADGTTAQDSAGNNNTGALINGPSRVTGRIGNALSFDGINDYVEINDNNALDLTGGEFTLSAWIYPESYGEALNGRIIDHGGGSGQNGGWSFLVNNEGNYQNLRQSIKDGNKGHSVYSDTGSIGLNIWQHAAVTLEAGTVTFYVNAQTAGQTAGVSPPTDRAAPVRIGMRATDLFRSFTGVIDEVSIYDRALSHQEIINLYNQAPPLSDMVPPVISDGQPSGVLPLDTITATLSVTTDEASTCKYAVFPDIPYSQMQDTFSSTGGTIHTDSISGLEYVQSRTYYVKCRDQSGNSSTADYTVSFSFNRSVYSVAPSGSDSNPGTEALPLRTVRHAVESADGNNAQETLIKVAQGTYYENISIVCCASRSNWRILGGWNSDFSGRDEDPSKTVLDGGGRQRVMKINVPALNLTIEGLTIRNGFDSATGGGIAVFPFYHGTITLNLINNIIARNTSGSAGGGVYVVSREYASTALTLIDNVIAHNGADHYCGGVCVISEDSASTIVTIAGNTIIDNQAGHEGGGIYVRSYNSAIITSVFSNNAITRNSAAYFGSGVYAYSESGATLTADFTDNRIAGNSAPYAGGGVYLHSVSNSTLTSNFTGNTITGNSASIHGGGIYALSAPGAAITSSIVNTNNIITDNIAGYDGGGVFSSGNTALNFTNNIIARNSASRGGGIFASEGSALTFTNDTITGNDAAFSGGGLCAHSAGDAYTTVNIKNTIVWGNGYNDIHNLGGSIINMSHSDTGSEAFGNDPANMNADPGFVDAVNENYHLSSSSPLIDQGDSSAASVETDIDGDPRIMYGKADIGADEHVFSFIKPDILPAMITDGDLSEYAEADGITLTPSAGGNSIKVQALWDSEALYLAYAVSDSQLNASITTRDGDVKKEDSAGWMIDTLNDDGGSADPDSPFMLPDDYLGLVNILNTRYDSRGTSTGAPVSSWNGSWQSAVQFNGTINDNADADSGYTAEVTIPWTDLGYATAPSGDTAVRMGFLLYDKDDSYCDVEPAGTYIDAENFTDTQDEAGNFSELTIQPGYLNEGYLRTLLPVGQNIFTTQTPPGNPHIPDNPLESGVKWTSDVNGYVTGVRFYKHNSNTGTHKGRLWQGTTLLANASFTNETSSGWQTAYFDSPVSVTAGTTYIVSYHSAGGYYYQSNNYFGTVNNPPLHISSIAGRNGVYKYGPASTFECSPMPCTPANKPDSDYNANFWADVIFVQALSSCSDISGREYKKYELDFPAGEYMVWLRGYAVAGADTVLVGVDGSCMGIYQFNTKNQWAWSNTSIAGTNSTGALSSGFHHIDMWTRQADVLLDGIYLTTGTETPTDGSHGMEIDPVSCNTTSHEIWPKGAGTAAENASNWLEMRFTALTRYYCDYDHDGHIASLPSNTCIGAECHPVNCLTMPGTDCNDNDFYEHPGQIWYKDSDNDDYSDGTNDGLSCARPPGYKAGLELISVSEDCDDANESAYPQAPEIWYDGVDHNCDGWNDYDRDRDGFVHENWNAGAGGSSTGVGDCDDADSEINPDTIWCPDSDGDGYGNPTVCFVQCIQPDGYVLNNLDCDDDDAEIYPGGPVVRIFGGSPSYYFLLQEAYDAAGPGEIIQCQDTAYAENLFFDQNKTIYIEGGYDCAYSVITGITTLNGSMIITDGSVTAEDFELQLVHDYPDY